MTHGHKAALAKLLKMRELRHFCAIGTLLGLALRTVFS